MAAFFSGTKYASNRKIQVVFRLIVAIPPLIGALFVKNLDSSKYFKLSIVYWISFEICWIVGLFDYICHPTSVAHCFQV